nr:metallophosphoesterase [uncultured Allomuricauda sp.]
MSSTTELSDQLTKDLLSIDQTVPIADNPLQSDWVFLKESEIRFIDFMKDRPLPSDGNLEYGPALYLLHQFPKGVVDILKWMGMPNTDIHKTDWDIWMKNVTNGPGVVAPDGTLYLETLYAQLDYHWTESLVYYLYYRWDRKADATFGTTPVTTKITGQDQLTIAIMGDWGTGIYNDQGFPSPSSLVGNAIKNLPPEEKADITLHLGDVYYAGLGKEEMNKLLKHFPRSKMANFTLNSNHEMYDGANGYFDVALANPLFLKDQNNTSYFAITFGNWVVIGLDTAFYDSSKMYMDGALYDTNQINFIKSLNIGATQKIILMTHHTGMTADGKDLTPPTYDGTNIKKPLFTQVVNALGRAPDYWYYGHIHNGIVYNDQSVAGKYKCPSGESPKLRCVGHGAIPFGKGTSLHTGGKTNPEIDYFSQTPMPNSTPPTKLLEFRVLNGFATITLGPNGIKEQFYEVSAITGTSKVWNNG